MRAQQGGEAFHWQPDDVRKAPPDDADKRVAILDAIGSRLAAPAVRVEISAALVLGEPAEPDDAPLDRPDPLALALAAARPLVAPGAIEANAGHDVAVASFLEPDHPLGVGPVGWLVEDQAVDRASRVGR